MPSWFASFWSSSLNTYLRCAVAAATITQHQQFLGLRIVRLAHALPTTLQCCHRPVRWYRGWCSDGKALISTHVVHPMWITIPDTRAAEIVIVDLDCPLRVDLDPHGRNHRATPFLLRINADMGKPTFKYFFFQTGDLLELGVSIPVRDPLFSSSTPFACDTHVCGATAKLRHD